MSFKPIALKFLLSRTEYAGLFAFAPNVWLVVGEIFGDRPASLNISQANSYQEQLPAFVKW
jgi:hypothetical protein